jgi:hypothetical protein
LRRARWCVPGYCCTHAGHALALPCCLLRPARAHLGCTCRITRAHTHTHTHTHTRTRTHPNGARTQEWKRDLAAVNPRAAEALADPQEYPNLFAGLAEAVELEPLSSKAQVRSGRRRTQPASRLHRSSLLPVADLQACRRQKHAGMRTCTSLRPRRQHGAHTHSLTPSHKHTNTHTQPGGCGAPAGPRVCRPGGVRAAGRQPGAAASSAGHQRWRRRRRPCTRECCCCGVFGSCSKLTAGWVVCAAACVMPVVPCTATESLVCASVLARVAARGQRQRRHACRVLASSSSTQPWSSSGR